MFGSAIIDIAIGVVFVFLLVSVIASTVNEIILSFLNMRGKELLTGLRTLLDDTDASGLVKKLYNHGQIFGLFQGAFDPKKPGNLPSYIPSQNFVMAFLDIIPAAAQLSTSGQQKAMAMTAAVNTSGTPPVSSPPVPANASLAPASGGMPAQPPSAPAANASGDAALFATLWVAAQKLAEEPNTEKVGKPLIAMLEAAGNDAAKLKKSLENWYNSAMDRVSGWYKYRTQKILFVIGLVLAVAMNIDAINILKQLSKDSTLRQSIVAAAGSAKQPLAPGDTEPLKNQIQDAKTEVMDVSNLGIPIGWSHVPDVLKTGAWHWHYLNIFLGWLVTALAVSLGAPFWFDMLNKIMVVRSTVKPHEKSQEEASKDT
jgi:hypothetical protein